MYNHSANNNPSAAKPSAANPSATKPGAYKSYCSAQARHWRCDEPPPKATAFHRTLPGYQRTALRPIPSVASQLGVGQVFVKDESMRLELPAFKILGASWATFKAVTSHLGAVDTPASIDALRELVSRSESITLVTATDGNHGRALARMAKMIGAQARIFAPDIIPSHAVDGIKVEGAELVLLAENYDKTVVRAAENAAGDASTILVQDTAWEGYEDAPQWIVDGYSTLFRETAAQLIDYGIPHPDVVVVPTGVGSLLQAVVAYYRSVPDNPPAILAVEPDTANCVTTSLHAGQLTAVDTGETNMAGLNCGTPSHIAWPFLRNGVDASITISDEAAASMSAKLGTLGVSSGPCGSSSLAGFEEFLRIDDGEHRQCLGLTPDSTVVLLNTEGAHGTT